MALEDVIRRLEQRIADLEADRMQYVGIWRPGQIYKRGNVVTHAGSMWHCQESTQDKPGTSKAFVLCVKHGKSARDARYD